MGIKLADLFVKIGADTSGVESGLDRTSALMQKTGVSLLKTGALLSASITAPIVLMGKSIAEASMHAEQSRIAFSTMLGSATRAKKFLDDLRAFAAKTPFEFTELEDASRRMLAFGFSASEVLPMMTAIGDATSGLGIGAEGVNRVVLALGQMQAKAKASAQEMMQMTEAGIPAWKYLAAAMGMTTGEAMKLVENGLVPARTAIDAILAGMESDFGGMMAAQMETAGGKASNLADAFEKLKISLGDTFLPQVTKGIDKLTGLVDSFNAMDAGAKKAIVTLLGTVALIGPATTMLGGLLAIAGKIGGAFIGAIAGIKAFGSGLSLTTALGAAGLTPIAIGLGSIAIAAGAVVAVWGTWNKQIVETNRLGKSAVQSGWDTFFENQAKSGVSATMVLKNYKDAQASVNQVLKDAGLLKIFIKDQEQLKEDTDGLSIALAGASDSYVEYLTVAATSGEMMSMLDEKQWNLVHSGYAMVTGFSNGKAQLELLTGSAENTKSSLEGLIKEYNDLKSSMDTWMKETAGSVATMLGSTLPESSKNFTRGLGAIDEIFGTTFLKEKEQKDATQALVDQFARTGDLEAFKTGLQEIKDEGLADMESKLAITAQKAGDLYNSLMNMPKDIKIAINFDTSSMPDWLKEYLKGGHSFNAGDTAGGTTGQTGQALGGPVWAGQTYLVGERRAELFIPSENGRIDPNPGRGIKFNNYGNVILGSEDVFSTELLAALS